MLRRLLTAASFAVLWLDIIGIFFRNWVGIGNCASRGPFFRVAGTLISSERLCRQSQLVPFANGLFVHPFLPQGRRLIEFFIVQLHSLSGILLAGSFQLHFILDRCNLLLNQSHAVWIHLQSLLQLRQIWRSPLVHGGTFAGQDIQHGVSRRRQPQSLPAASIDGYSLLCKIHSHTPSCQFRRSCKGWTVRNPLALLGLHHCQSQPRSGFSNPNRVHLCFRWQNWASCSKTEDLLCSTVVHSRPKALRWRWYLSCHRWPATAVLHPVSRIRSIVGSSSSSAVFAIRLPCILLQ